MIYLYHWIICGCIDSYFMILQWVLLVGSWWPYMLAELGLFAIVTMWAGK